MRDPSRHHPSAVSNSIRILETVAQLGIGVTAKEIASALSMPPATAYRLLNALVEEEYLVRTSDLRGFALGRGLDGLIGAATSPTISTAARTCIADLRSRVRFGVHLISFSPSSLRVVEADADHPIRAERELVRYLHASAAGKLLLAYATDWRSPLPRGPLAQVTPRTITNLAALDAELQQIRRREYANQIDELATDLACLAVPVKHPRNGIGGAICLAGPAARSGALVSHLDQIQVFAKQLAPMVY